MYDLSGIYLRLVLFHQIIHKSCLRVDSLIFIFNLTVLLIPQYNYLTLKKIIMQNLHMASTQNTGFLRSVWLLVTRLWPVSLVSERGSSVLSSFPSFQAFTACRGANRPRPSLGEKPLPVATAQKWHRKTGLWGLLTGNSYSLRPAPFWDIRCGGPIRGRLASTNPAPREGAAWLPVFRWHLFADILHVGPRVLSPLPGFRPGRKSLHPPKLRSSSISARMTHG